MRVSCNADFIMMPLAGLPAPNFFSLSVRPTNGILTRHSFKDMGKLIKSLSRHKIDRMTQEASPTLSENVTLERTRQVCDGEDQEFPPEEVHSSPP